MRKKLYPFLAIGFLLLYPVRGEADTVSLTPTYTYTVIDSVTGSNFISGEGWYVDSGADEHENDFIRERPLGTDT